MRRNRADDRGDAFYHAVRDEGFWQSLGAEPSMPETPDVETNDPEVEAQSEDTLSKLDSPEALDEEIGRIAELSEAEQLSAASNHSLEEGPAHKVLALAVLRHFVRSGLEIEEHHHTDYQALLGELSEEQRQQAFSLGEALTWEMIRDDPRDGEEDRNDVGETGYGGWTGEEEAREARDEWFGDWFDYVDGEDV